MSMNWNDFNWIILLSQAAYHRKKQLENDDLLPIDVIQSCLCPELKWAH